MANEKSDGVIPTGLGRRLKEERERLQLTQAALAKIAGLGRLSQIAYEAETSAPRTSYLSAVRTAGVDILYLILGIRENDLTSATDDSIEVKAFEMVESYAATQASGDLHAEARRHLFYVYRKVISQIEMGHLPRSFNPLSLITLSDLDR